jgi:hypothetical protein
VLPTPDSPPDAPVREAPELRRRKRREIRHPTEDLDCVGHAWLDIRGPSGPSADSASARDQAFSHPR